MTVKLRVLPTHPLLGRHVEHDDRSKRFLVPAMAGAVVFAPVKYVGVAPILDQGDLGACTGYSCTGLISYIDSTLSTLPKTPEAWNDFALALYSLATQLDEFKGQYPPTDTGSSGLGVAKAAQQKGFASGYLHITSPAALATALKTGPVIVGTSWYNGMFDPDVNGLLTVNTKSGLAGGHEYVLDEVTADGRFGFRNSWGESFGVEGRFYMKQADFLKLLADDGDATQLVPVSQPAPQPVDPTPTPDPTPPAPVDPSDDENFIIEVFHKIEDWLKAHGLL